MMSNKMHFDSQKKTPLIDWKMEHAVMSIQFFIIFLYSICVGHNLEGFSTSDKYK